MQLHYGKTLITAAWVALVFALGIVTHVASPASWAVLALITVAPPAALWRLWSPPSPSLSETIQKARQ